MPLLKHIFALLLSAALFFCSWPPHQMTAFVFVAFVPVTWVLLKFKTDEKKSAERILYVSLYLLFFAVNFSLTSWVMNAHLGGGLFASIFNAFLMTGVVVLVHKIKKHLGDRHALLAFPFIWLAFEYLHLNWELTWPWMTLGHVFSNQPSWIQWYEYTGALGGSLWVLWVNVLVYRFLSIWSKRKFSMKAFSLMILVFLGPYLISQELKPNGIDSETESIRVVVVQPNYEPHHEKFRVPQSIQLSQVETLLDPAWTSPPDLIVLPETFITDWVWESRIEYAPSVIRLKSWLKNHPETQILTGASTGKVLTDTDSLKATARKSRAGVWYEVFNTALLLSADAPTQIFHKSKLVPGAEMTPYSGLLKPLLDRFPIEIGGSVGNFGVNDSVFNLSAKQGSFAPMICYESIFGAYVSEFVNAGAHWICIITNDGWWGYTYGHEQHQAYARLRAIETRRTIVRSANTGISSVILPDGDVEQFLGYGEAGILQATLSKSHVHTFYVQHGDYIGRLASFLAVVYLLQLIMRFQSERRFRSSK